MILDNLAAAAQAHTYRFVRGKRGQERNTKALAEAARKYLWLCSPIAPTTKNKRWSCRRCDRTAVSRDGMCSPGLSGQFCGSYDGPDFPRREAQAILTRDGLYGRKGALDRRPSLPSVAKQRLYAGWKCPLCNAYEVPSDTNNPTGLRRRHLVAHGVRGSNYLATQATTAAKKSATFRDNVAAGKTKAKAYDAKYNAIVERFNGVRPPYAHSIVRRKALTCSSTQNAQDSRIGVHGCVECKAGCVGNPLVRNTKCVSLTTLMTEPCPNAVDKSMGVRKATIVKRIAIARKIAIDAGDDAMAAAKQTSRKCAVHRRVLVY